MCILIDLVATFCTCYKTIIPFALKGAKILLERSPFKGNLKTKKDDVEGSYIEKSQL